MPMPKKMRSDQERFAAMAVGVRYVAESMLNEFYGERCETFEPSCVCCNRWRHLDALVANPFEDGEESCRLWNERAK